MSLVSPGIQVTVTDESNYSPTQIGSVPFILIATDADKPAAGGSGIAAGTLTENAGKLYAITSQRDLVTTFGTPTFYTTTAGAPINAGEQNEYGLLAAYSALGVSNQAYVMRCDAHLSELNGTSLRPLANPDNGTWWIDSTATNWGIYEWNADTQTFALVTPSVITSTAFVANNTPRTTYGSIGDYAIDATTSVNALFYKAFDNTWYLVGSTNWQSKLPAVTGSNASVSISSNANIIINGTSVRLNAGSNVNTVSTAINSALGNANVAGVSTRVSSNRLVVSITSNSASNGSTVDGRANISFTANSLSTDLGITAGSYYAPATEFASYFSQPQWLSIDPAPRPSQSIWVKTTATGNGLNVAYKQYSSTTESWRSVTAGSYFDNGDAIYALDPTGGGLNISLNTVFNKFNLTNTGLVGVNFNYRKNTGPTVMIGSTSTPTAGSNGDKFWIQVTQPGKPGYNRNATIGPAVNGTSVVLDSNNDPIYKITLGGTGSPSDFVAAISAANIPNLTAEITPDGNISITHLAGGDVRFLGNEVGTPLTNMGITAAGTNLYQSLRASPSPLSGFLLNGTNFAPLSELDYTVSATQPYAAPADNTLWYWNDPTHADIMINDGTAWRGYKSNAISGGTDIRGYNLQLTDLNGPIFSSSAPTTQSGGGALQYGDLWIDTSDLENYPIINRWQNVNGVDQWVLIDNADNTGQNGIIFADARWSTSGTIDPALGTVPSLRVLQASDYTDLDCPDPGLYPRGILLFNTRASGFNVKRYRANYFNSTSFPGESLPTQKDAWVSTSGYQDNGIVPFFGRKAPRSVVVAEMKSAIDSSTALREEQYQFNIIACPGYPELIPNMVALNNDRGNTAFVIGDTPMRLPATGTDIQAWANNSAGSAMTGESGLATTDPYVGIFYPHGLTSDLGGNSVVVPASHAMIRAFLRSDNTSYPWFAPAGTRRGLIDNLSAIGYTDPDSGSFVQIGVTEGLRDIMYTNKINPLTFLPGTGILAYGNKTIAGANSALDRINVARLVNYIRTQLNTLARPFVFEPNDPVTQNQVKAVVSSLLNDLVSKRGIYDYLVVCDSTNNTPERVAANELYVDVAIEPTKDVEFIYIPIRLTNPGTLQSNNISPAQTTGTGA